MSTPDPTAEFIAAGTEFFKQMRLENQAHMTANLTRTLGDTNKRFKELEVSLTENSKSSEKLARSVRWLTGVAALAAVVSAVTAVLEFLHKT